MTKKASIKLLFFFLCACDAHDGTFKKNDNVAEKLLLFFLKKELYGKRLSCPCHPTQSLLRGGKVNS